MVCDWDWAWECADEKLVVEEEVMVVLESGLEIVVVVAVVLLLVWETEDADVDCCCLTERNFTPFRMACIMSSRRSTLD